MKLGQIETRAKAYCNQINESGSGYIAIEWRKSRIWGRVAVILDNRGYKAAEASGCGYDKESACLVELLKFLCPSCSVCGGAGFRSVEIACEKDGWRLAKTVSGETFDAFHIERI